VQAEREKQVILKELNDIAIESKQAKSLLKSKEEENRNLKSDIRDIGNDNSRLHTEMKEVKNKLQESYSKRESDKRNTPRQTQLRSPGPKYEEQNNSEMKKLLEQRLENERNESDRKSNEIMTIKNETLKLKEMIDQLINQNSINNLELDKLKDEIYRGLRAVSNLRENNSNLDEDLVHGYSQKSAKEKILILQSESRELFSILKSLIDKNASLELETSRLSNKEELTDRTDTNNQADRKTLSENRD